MVVMMMNSRVQARMMTSIVVMVMVMIGFLGMMATMLLSAAEVAMTFMVTLVTTLCMAIQVMTACLGGE